jgi:hypothetical protein
VNQVYLPAIAGHVPSQMVRAISAFMEFCYLVRRNVIDEDDILAISSAIAEFHVARSIFDDVRPISRPSKNPGEDQATKRLLARCLSQGS